MFQQIKVITPLVQFYISNITNLKISYFYLDMEQK